MWEYGGYAWKSNVETNFAEIIWESTKHSDRIQESM